MEDIFGDILRDSVLRAGGTIPVRKFPGSELFASLNTNEDIFVAFRIEKTGECYAAQLFTTPADAKDIEILSREGMVLDTLPMAHKRAHVLYYCVLDKPYTFPMTSNLIDTHAPKYQIQLELNSKGKIKGVELDFRVALAKFVDTINGTSNSGKLFYISRLALEHLTGYALVDLGEDIFDLPMEQICSKTVESIRAKGEKLSTNKTYYDHFVRAWREERDGRRHS